MSKFTDEQVESMLKNDSLRIPGKLEVSREHIYEAVNDRMRRAKRVKVIVISVLMTVLAVGTPVLDAAIRSARVVAPKVTYEAPGITTTVTPLNPAAKATMEPKGNQGQGNQAQSANQASSGQN